MEENRIDRQFDFFREIDKELQKAIGRANKYLHWQDIKFLKQNNVEKYDWGGAFWY